MQFSFLEGVLDRARSAAGANLCLEWLQEKFFPNLAVRSSFSCLEVSVPYSCHNQDSVLGWLPGALIIPLVNLNMAYAY